ncbi:MAG: hypothetical protein WBF13_01865 [Candidatus Zixiibacteriota bacterium]
MERLYLYRTGEAEVRASLCITQPGSPRAVYCVSKTPSVVWAGLFVIVPLLLSISSVSAETTGGKLRPIPIGNEEGSMAELSVLVSDSTFAFGTSLPSTWLAPQTSVITNDGTVAENFLGRISQFTDGTNSWDIDASSNGADTVRAQWSPTSQDGPWTDISAYDTDFTIATNVAVSDSATFWFRIQTPVGTSSYDEHSSTLTVTAQEY